MGRKFEHQSLHKAEKLSVSNGHKIEVKIVTMTRQSNEGRRVALTHTRRKEGNRENYSDETTALGDGTPLASEGHHGGEAVVFSSPERWKRASH